jgi:hypothetical protein
MQVDVGQGFVQSGKQLAGSCIGKSDMCTPTLGQLAKAMETGWSQFNFDRVFGR